MLEYRDVNVSVQRNQVLKNVSITFQKNVITTILGPNGCGKTTLLQCLNGGSKVDKGQIWLDDKDYLSLPLKERAKRVSFLPQIRSVIPSLPVEMLVSHGRFPYTGFARVLTEADKNIINEAMRITRIQEYKEKCVDQLSGGVRQRVYLAMTIAQNCEYIVLDEPTTYLDFNSQKLFLEIIQKLKEQGKTIILVLHDLNQAFQISDRIVLMNQGEIVSHNTTKESIQSGVIEAVYQTQFKYFHDEEGDYFF